MPTSQPASQLHGGKMSHLTFKSTYFLQNVLSEPLKNIPLNPLQSTLPFPCFDEPEQTDTVKIIQGFEF